MMLNGINPSGIGVNVNTPIVVIKMANHGIKNKLLFAINLATA